MLIIYDTFHLVTCEDGILMVSTKSSDHPFIFTNNSKFGFVISHAGEVNWGVRYKIKESELLDMTKMTTYLAGVAGNSHWAVAIPYQGKTINPHALYNFEGLDVYKQFSHEDFPNSFYEYRNLAIITGICE
jgi:hypothetical protein